jgi:Complex 1 protein (LYR family)
MRPHPTPILSLPHFLQQQRTLSLYRSILRSLHKMPRNSSQRAELYRFARGEFERNRRVEDLAKIRYLVSTGRTEFEGVRRYVEGLAG